MFPLSTLAENDLSGCIRCVYELLAERHRLEFQLDHSLHDSAGQQDCKISPVPQVFAVHLVIEMLAGLFSQAGGPLTNPFMKAILLVEVCRDCRVLFFPPYFLIFHLHSRLLFFFFFTRFFHFFLFTVCFRFGWVHIFPIV